MRFSTERNLPLYIGFLGVAVGVFMPLSAWPRMITAFAPTVINVASISVGFMASSYSLLLAMEEREIIKKLKAAGRYGVLLQYLNTAIKSGFLVAILAAVAMFLDPDNVPREFRYFVPLWLGVVGFTLSASYRIISLIASLLSPPRSNKR